MRIGSVTLGCLAVVALLLIGVMAGCGEKPDTGEVSIPTPETAPGTVPDEGSAQAPAADIPESAETMADVLETFQIPSSFVMTVTTQAEGEEPEQSGTMTVMMDGPQMAKMRMEEEGEEGSEVMIMDFEGNVMISYNTATKEGFQFPLNEDEAENVPDVTEGYNPDYRILGSETVDGVDCWIVEVTGEEGEGKMWIGKADGLMRKAEAPEGTQIMSYTDINEVSESVFDVPEDIELADMSDMQIPDMPEDEGGE